MPDRCLPLAPSVLYGQDVRYAARGQEARSRDGQDVMDRMSGMRRAGRRPGAALYAARGHAYRDVGGRPRREQAVEEARSRPAKTGIHASKLMTNDMHFGNASLSARKPCINQNFLNHWIPAFAGMTAKSFVGHATGAMYQRSLSSTARTVMPMASIAPSRMVSFCSMALMSCFRLSSSSRSACRLAALCS